MRRNRQNEPLLFRGHGNALNRFESRDAPRSPFIDCKLTKARVRPCWDEAEGDMDEHAVGK